jgi:hypothetical protein
LNPLKLAGQCGKLKCCLNYELDSYLDAQKDFPDTSIPLETLDGLAYHQKTDVFRHIFWYTYNQEEGTDFIALSVERVREIIEENKKGIKVKLIDQEINTIKNEALDYKNVVGQESLTRFDKKDNKSKYNNNWKNKPSSS